MSDALLKPEFVCKTSLVVVSFAFFFRGSVRAMIYISIFSRHQSKCPLYTFPLLLVNAQKSLFTTKTRHLSNRLQSRPAKNSLNTLLGILFSILVIYPKPLCQTLWFVRVIEILRTCAYTNAEFVGRGRDVFAASGHVLGAYRCNVQLEQREGGQKREALHLSRL